MAAAVRGAATTMLIAEATEAARAAVETEAAKVAAAREQAAMVAVM